MKAFGSRAVLFSNEDSMKLADHREMTARWLCKSYVA